MTETPLGVPVGRLAQADPDRPPVTRDGVTIPRAAREARTDRRALVYRDLGGDAETRTSG
ncbi:MAG: hypothetical protein ACREJE_05125 [Candidatus Rokuibacteriota bacterium]